MHISMLQQQPPPCACCHVIIILFTRPCLPARQQWACEQSNVLIKNGESVACTSCLPPPFIIRRQLRIRDEAKIVRFNISSSSSSSGSSLAANLFMPSDKCARASHAFIMMNDEMNKRSRSPLCLPFALCVSMCRALAQFY